MQVQTLAGMNARLLFFLLVIKQVHTTPKNKTVADYNA
jgi:hypothetical protein